MIVETVRTSRKSGGASIHPYFEFERITREGQTWGEEGHKRKGAITKHQFGLCRGALFQRREAVDEFFEALVIASLTDRLYEPQTFDRFDYEILPCRYLFPCFVGPGGVGLRQASIRIEMRKKPIEFEASAPAVIVALVHWHTMPAAAARGAKEKLGHDNVVTIAENVR